QLLIERGFDIGAVDGIWGPRSAAAMSDLQRELGLPVTGLPDAATLEAMTAPPPSEDSVPSEQPAAPEVIVAEPITKFGGSVEPNEIIAEPAVQSEDPSETEVVATQPIQEATATPMQEVAEPADFSFFLLVAA